MVRTRVTTGAPWESLVGYSRAVRVGDRVAVTGTVGIGPDGKVVPGGAYAQARRAIEIIGAALWEVDVRLADVIRTRIYVTNIERDWEAVGRAHAEAFGDIRPATTMVEVSRLIDADMLVEIEAEAVAGSA